MDREGECKQDARDPQAPIDNRHDGGNDRRCRDSTRVKILVGEVDGDARQGFIRREAEQQTLS